MSANQYVAAGEWRVSEAISGRGLGEWNQRKQEAGSRQGAHDATGSKMCHAMPCHAQVEK